MHLDGLEKFDRGPGDVEGPFTGAAVHFDVAAEASAVQQLDLDTSGEIGGEAGVEVDLANAACAQSKHLLVGHRGWLQFSQTKSATLQACRDDIGCAELGSVFRLRSSLALCGFGHDGKRRCRKPNSDLSDGRVREGRGTIADVIIGASPFVISMFGLIVLLMIWPDIALFLPNLIMGAQ